MAGCTAARPPGGGKGGSDDKALAGPGNGVRKAGLIHRRAPWTSREAVEVATLRWGGLLEQLKFRQ